MNSDQQRVIASFRAAAHASGDVVAAFVSGSIGAGTSDQFSDVDCSLVFANHQARAAAWSVRESWFARLGELVVVGDATHVGTWLQVGVLRGPVLVDLSYKTPDQLVPSPWYQQLLVIKDTANLLGDLQSHSEALDHPRADPLALSNLSRLFWRWAVFTARDVRRGDVAEVLDSLNFLRTHALQPMAAAAAGLPWARFCRLEGAVGSEATALIRAGYPQSLRSDDLAAALLDQVNAFLSLRELAQVRVPHPVDLDEAACMSAVKEMLAL